MTTQLKTYLAYMTAVIGLVALVLPACSSDDGGQITPEEELAADYLAVVLPVAVFPLEQAAPQAASASVVPQGVIPTCPGGGSYVFDQSIDWMLILQECSFLVGGLVVDGTIDFLSEGPDDYDIEYRELTIGGQEVFGGGSLTTNPSADEPYVVMTVNIPPFMFLNVEVTDFTPGQELFQSSFTANVTGRVVNPGSPDTPINCTFGTSLGFFLTPEVFALIANGCNFGG